MLDESYTRHVEFLKAKAALINAAEALPPRQAES